MRINRRKISRWAAYLILGIVFAFGAYMTLLANPGLFFSHTLRRNGITLYSDEPIPPEHAGQILEDVEGRLARSPLAASSRMTDLHVYICNKQWRFALFAQRNYRAGGLAYSLFTENIFLREVHFEKNRLVGYSGNEPLPPRTASYFIAHEIVHVLVRRELGTIKQWQLPEWKNEGYADYVAKGSDFDYGQVREQLRRGERDLNPTQSGLYLRYHLLVAYLLEKKKIGVDELFRGDFDSKQLEQEILAAENGHRN
jgi:hypothetical protein